MHFPFPDKTLVLFDGVCNLCNGTVLWLIARDKQNKLMFASLQDEKVKALLQAAPAPVPDSIIAYDGTQFYYQSDAAIKIATELGGFWKTVGIYRFIPRFIREGLYAFIARNRYRWFGKKEACMVPTPAMAAKFW